MGILITYNPFYKGRSLLPDNLKSLLRPIAMVVPDYTLITEILLFGEGILLKELLNFFIHKLLFIIH